MKNTNPVNSSSNQEQSFEYLFDSVLENTEKLEESAAASSRSEIEDLKCQIALLTNKLEALLKLQAAATPAVKEENFTDSISWRGQPVSEKQRSLLKKLRFQMINAGFSIRGTKTPNNRGEAHALIKRMLKTLGGNGRGKIKTEGCSIGPFVGGFCMCCGLKQC